MIGSGRKVGNLVSCACLVAGGVLWALSPLGVHLSELKLKNPDVFWSLFSSAPLLMLAGLLGLHLRHPRAGSLRIASLAVIGSGVLLVVAGNVGQFYLGLDEAHIMSAPAYRAFRIGLVILAAGSVAFGVVATRSGGLSAWSALPFSAASVAGLVAVSGDFGSLGATLWILFGFGWAWLGVVVLLGYVVRTNDSREPELERGA